MSFQNNQIANTWLVWLAIPSAKFCKPVLAVTSREIQAAVRLILTGDLASNAISEGSKAVMQLTISNSNIKASEPEEASDEVESDGSFTIENLS